MTANEAVGVAMRRVVMGPVDHRRTAGIVDHLATNFDSIARANRTARRNAYVIHHFDLPGAGLNVEGFVHRVRTRSIKETRRRCNGSGEINPGGSIACICGGKIHRRSLHSAEQVRQEPPVIGQAA